LEADRLIAEGNRLEERGEVRAALEKYTAAVASAPQHAGAHLNLGIGLQALGELDAAAASYETALRLDPSSPYPAYNLAKLLHARGAHARAEELLRSALARKPDFGEAGVVLAAVLESLGRSADALAVLEQIVAKRPDFAMAHYWRGNALVRLARPDAALESYRRAVELDPRHAGAWCNLGNVLCDFGRTQEAAECLKRALALEPDAPDALVGMGNVHAAGQDMEQAEACFRRALARDRSYVQAHINLGNALKYQGRTAEALACFEAALALDAGSPEARWSRAMAQVSPVPGAGDDPAAERAAFGAAVDDLGRWFDAARTPLGAQVVGIEQPFWLAYQEQPNRELLARYGALCARLMSDWQARQHLPRPRMQKKKPMRIGIVSQYFRDHSVWQALVKGWLAGLDPQRFAVHAFWLGTGADRETDYARRRAARFMEGAGGLRGWAEAILAADLDALIYPEVGMDPMTLKLAALRLAPVQAASWGHPETSGLPTIDLYLSAQDFEPQGAEANYTERLVALPNLGCCVEPSHVEPAPAEPPQGPLLLCAGAPFKYAPEHDRVLVEIARRLGKCRLVFFTHRYAALSEKLRRRLAAAFGADFDRFVRFVPWQAKREFYGWLHAADVYLDSIGFSGFNTALQALECALPVVAREGRFMRGRLASGILRRIGMEDLVAATEEQYIETAVRLATDRSRRNELSRRIAARLRVVYEDRAPIEALQALLEAQR
jgi:predicted O-linked N-acetylglucosamine transferase (SPINDLY family)